MRVIVQAKSRQFMVRLMGGVMIGVRVKARLWFWPGLASDL